jgi:transposase-like protein
MASILYIRHWDKVDPPIILVALGVDLLGSKEVLARRPYAEESKDGWACLLQDLRTRGATKIDLIVTDGHDGRTTRQWMNCLRLHSVSTVWSTNNAM